MANIEELHKRQRMLWEQLEALGKIHSQARLQRLDAERAWTAAEGSDKMKKLKAYNVTLMEYEKARAAHERAYRVFEFASNEYKEVLFTRRLPETKGKGLE